MFSLVFEILIGTLVGLWAILIAVVWVGMFVRFAWLALKEWRRHGLKAFRMSVEGNPFNDIG